MATVTSVTKHFPVPKEGFITTTASSIGSGAATVPLNSVTGYTNGDTVVLVIDPADATKKQAFTGVIDTAGVQITGVVWTEGTNTTHAAGATVVDYVAATHLAMYTKGMLRDHNQSAYHKALHDDNAATWIGQTATASAVNYVNIANAATTTGPTISAQGTDSNIDLTILPKGTGKIKPGFMDGWEYGVLPAVSSVAGLGNRSYNVTYASTVASYLTPGTRLRFTRTVAAPTQCTSLNGTTQFYNKTSPNKMTFTNNFVCSAWVKLTTYVSGGTAFSIVSRYNGTSGWDFAVGTTGQVTLTGFNAGAANNLQLASINAIPLNKWVHVAAQMDMTTTTVGGTNNYIMVDGVDVLGTATRSGTNPTALVQAGNLEIGSRNAGTNFWAGKLAQVAVYSAKVTEAVILASMDRTLAGNETSLASAWSFNNSIADLNTTTPNDLTAQASAVATTADSPFGVDATGTPGVYEYGIVTKVATTVATVQMAEGCAIPTTGGVSASELSSWKAPFGMPVTIGKWTLESWNKTYLNPSVAATSQWFASNWGLTIPIGAWQLSYGGAVRFIQGTAAGSIEGQVTLSVATPTNAVYDTFTCSFFHSESGATVTSNGSWVHRENWVELTAQTTYLVYGAISTGTGTVSYSFHGANSPSAIKAVLAYL